MNNYGTKHEIAKKNIADPFILLNIFSFMK